MQIHTLKPALLAAMLVSLGGAALAADVDATATREQRMGDALQTYRGATAADKNPDPGRFARAEEATKRGAGKTGQAIQHGAQKAEHAVARGAEKTGDVVRRANNKVRSKTTASTTNPQ